MSIQNMFKLDVVVPISALGPVMEQVLAAHGRIMRCDLLGIEAPTKKDRVLQISKAAKTKRRHPRAGKGKTLDLAREQLTLAIDATEVGQWLHISPVAKAFKEAGGKTYGSFWKMIQILIAEGRIEKTAARGAYKRLV